MLWNLIFWCLKLFSGLLPGVFFDIFFRNFIFFSTEKKMKFLNLVFFFTFCLIVSWVFVIETITGSQIKDFWLGVWNLGSNLRKLYPADCQTMGLSNYRNIEGTSKMSKKTPGSSPENNFRHQNIKFHNICNYWFYWCFVQKVLLTGFI